MSRAAPRASSTPMPPGLLGATLALWGWHTGLLVYAVAMALALEAARWVAWRWDLSDRDFNRVTDLSSLGFVVVVLYQFDLHSFHGIYAILELLPFVLFPLVALQLYSTRRGVRLTALLLSLRRAAAKGLIEEERSIDLSFPYLVVCLIAAAAGDLRSAWFYPLTAALVGAALWSARPRRYPSGVWAVMLALGLGGGYVLHEGALQLRWALQPILVEWIHDHFWQTRNPYRAHTAIGTVGRLKSSDRIILRVRPAPASDYPALLRDAAYQTFSQNTWLAGVTRFAALAPQSEGTAWPLHEGSAPDRHVDIAAFLPRGKGLLPVPNGTYRIENLPVEALSLNPLGALRVERGPGLVRYRARYHPGLSYDLAPHDNDLEIPLIYEDLMHETAREIGLMGAPAERAPVLLERYFAQGFAYSLARGQRRYRTPLGEFLRETRRGHCEYFASAAVLLLRAAGIPARYATGYSVQEWSELEKRFVVRRRHAHAWALAYIDGAWRDVDTTPAVWGEVEAAAVPWWASAYDVWAWLAFQFSKWRWGETEEGTNELLLWLLAPLFAVLAWRLYRQERVSLGRAGKKAGEAPVARSGLDSEFYRIEASLRETGLTRGVGETFTAYLERAAGANRIAGAAELIDDILPLHYGYRFDPRGVSDAEREELRRRVAEWLRRHPVSATP